MKKLVYLLSGIILSFLLSACASNPSNVFLDPQPNIQPSDIGGGKRVMIQVEDARPQGVEAEYAAAKIDPSQSVDQVMMVQMVRGLTAHGFVPMASTAATNNVLTVQILLIDYGTLSGVAATSTRSEVSAVVTITNSAGTFHKTYHASSYSDNYLQFTHVNASQQVNMAVSNLLENMLNDPSLLHFLAN